MPSSKPRASHRLGRILTSLIAVVGFLITLAWLFTGNRRKLAIRLTSRQARYLEKKIFSEELQWENGIPKGRVEDYFPMFFSGNRAVMASADFTLEPHEEKIKEHFSSTKTKPKTISGKIDQHFSHNSESNVMTVWVPFLFLFAWAILFLWQL